MNQSVFVNFLSIVIIIIGILIFSGMVREVFPNVSFDVVTVETNYPGASPLDVEKLISVPIEKELKEVDGIEEITSSSTHGLSVISVQIDPDVSNKDKVIRDIRNAVERVTDLPKDIYDDPIVTEITTKQYPIVEVSLAADVPEKKLQEYADILEEKIEDVKGVARVRKLGYRDKEVQVRVSPEKMKDYYVSFDEMEQALASRNIALPAGEISAESKEYSIRTTAEFEKTEDVENTIIRANDAGNWLQIKDTACVIDGFKKEKIISKAWGKRAINLVVLKKESGDAITIVKKIKEICAVFKAENKEDIKISYINDYSFLVKRRLGILIGNGISGFIFVALLMMLFFERRTAFLTVLGIPTALCATFIGMGMMGVSINLVSMFGLIVALGMLVDQGIVIADNVYRYIEKGLPVREAVVKGTEEVSGAVTSSVITTIAAFFPLLFMTGIIGKFIWSIPIVVSLSLLASLGEALIILPSHLADFIKIKYDKNGELIRGSRGSTWFKTFQNKYEKLLISAVKYKYFVMASFSGVLIVCLFLAGFVVKFILFPAGGIDCFFIRMEAPIGTNLEVTNELVTPYEEAVSKLPREELESYVTTVGSIAEDRNDPFEGRGSNLVQITVYLTAEQDRKRGVEEIIADLREKTRGIKGFEEIRFDKPESGPPVGKPIEVTIRGENFHVLDEIAFEYMDYLKTIDGTSDITWDNKPGKEEIRVVVDHNKATMAGLTIYQIAKTVRAVFEGTVATKIKPVKADEDTDVTIMFPENLINKINVFEEILVQNKYGNLIPLKNVAKITRVPGSTTVHHLDGKRVVTVSCNVDTDKTTVLKVTALLQKKFSNISARYSGYSVKYGGEQEETVDSLISLLKSFLYAFLFIYLILTYSFKSLTQPLIIMLSIPFGLIGVILSFWAHGLPLSFMAILGIVGLNGIVVNDAIVLVEFINNLRESGMSKGESIIQASKIRLRAIIVTTVTTSGGLFTVAYGIGGKDPFLVPMAMAISWGLMFSTALTLIVIPCLYSILDDWGDKFLEMIGKGKNNSVKNS
ncbi:export membrane protein [Candidatus Omnitrophus magneticus]|uniref:Export membrane protein n=1 Tax=Candidatus Omnitrophus magneticus TaxID=1609969 RepID=A0A0F0CUS9_9BACT|nr:export membrane protein [Candidatus Omnitrophus magneticus]